jgi:DNA processing protein
MDNFVGTKALLAIPGVGNKTVMRIVSVLGSLESADEAALDRAIRDIAATSTRIRYAGMDWLHEALVSALQHGERMAIAGLHALTKDHVDYPASLTSLPDAPQILYARGNLALLQPNPSVALVGTRTPTDFAARALHRLAYRLGSQGITVISGMASGSDDAAHRGCLEAGGPTIAVLGCALDCIENPEKQQMADAILNANGLLISEYPMGTQSTAFQLIRRNWIIAHLARGVICGQASETGGSRHAVKAAAKRGAPLAVLAPRNDGDYSGNEAWIRDLHALPLVGRADFEAFLRQVVG